MSTHKITWEYKIEFDWNIVGLAIAVHFESNEIVLIIPFVMVGIRWKQQEHTMDSEYFYEEELTKLRDALKCAIEALEYYADKSRWDSVGGDDVYVENAFYAGRGENNWELDGNVKAKQALNKINKEVTQEDEP